MRTRIVDFLMLAGLVVASAACHPRYPSCRKDKDCHTGEHCVAGQCQQCASDSDCGPGQRCNAGACTAAEVACRSDADCGNGKRCDGGRCVTLETTEAPTRSSAACELANVHFPFDDSTLDDGARRALDSNVECLGARHVQSAVVTGHADPRGTEEYNLALGHRRASAASDYLVSRGLGRDHVRTRSMGEEAATGTDEASWANDRRADVSPQ